MTDKLPSAKFPPWEAGKGIPHPSLTDMVNSPPHYRQGSVECFDAIQAMLTKAEFDGYCKGNVVKYIWRENHKGRVESLKKAQWYLNKLVESHESTTS